MYRTLKRTGRARRWAIRLRRWRSPPRCAHVLALSARTPEALRDLLALYRRTLSAEPASLADFCYTANTGRSHFAYRVAAWGDNAAGILRRLPDAISSPVRPGLSIA